MGRIAVRDPDSERRHLSMARATQTRRSQRFLGDENNRIVHDLDRAKGPCEIEEILDEGRGMRFEPDTFEQATSERYRPCTRCIDA